MKWYKHYFDDEIYDILNCREFRLLVAIESLFARIERYPSMREIKRLRWYTPKAFKGLEDALNDVESDVESRLKVIEKCLKSLKGKREKDRTVKRESRSKNSNVAVDSTLCPYKEESSNNTSIITREEKSITPKPPKGDSLSKEEKEEYFNQFWKEYPRKIEKQSARKKFLKLVKTKKDVFKIAKALERYVRHINDSETKKQFIKYPTSWLNNDIWISWLAGDIEENEEAVADRERLEAVKRIEAMEAKRLCR